MRPRKPTSMHRTSGTYRADRHGAWAEDGASLPPLGDPPERLTKEQKAIWYETADEAPAGVLRASDRTLVEITVRLIEDLRRGEFTAAHVTQLRLCLSSLGMTPVDRSRVESLLTPEDDDPADEFLN